MQKRKSKHLLAFSKLSLALLVAKHHLLSLALCGGESPKIIVRISGCETPLIITKIAVIFPSFSWLRENFNIFLIKNQYFLSKIYIFFIFSIIINMQQNHFTSLKTRRQQTLPFFVYKFYFFDFKTMFISLFSHGQGCCCLFCGPANL